MRIVGIDLGISCGWAVFDPNGQRVASGTWKLDPGRRIEKGRAPKALRWAAMLEHCRVLFREHRPALAVYEDVRRHGGTDAAHCWGALSALLELAAHECDVPLAWVQTTEWKIAIGATRHALAEAYVAAVNQRLGLQLERHQEDEAAALGIALAGLQRRGQAS